MILLQIEGIPVPWKAHAGYGKKSFNPRYRERAMFQWQIRAQYNQLDPLSVPVWCDYTFHMPIPEGTSKVRRLQMLNGKIHHIKRPDASNLVKMYEDCLKGIIFDDDSQVVEFTARKIYSETPKVVIRVGSAIDS